MVSIQSKLHAILGIIHQSNKLFSEYTVTVSQLLFSADTLQNHEEKEHLVDTFNQLLDYGALAIINENDSVYIEELLNGDNDCLSAMVATLMAVNTACYRSIHGYGSRNI